MATNNYFGFTPGGTQYGTTATPYQPGQAGYAVTPAPATPGTYTAQRAGTGYETAYQAAATHTTPGTYAVGAATPATGATYDYGYGRTPQTAYDGSKTYYQQPAAATYSATETHYQASKPAFSTTSTYTATTRPVTQATPKPPTYTPSYNSQSTTNYTPAYPAPAQTTTPSKGYDAALYSAATMYVQQAQTTGAAAANKPATSTWQAYKKGPVGAAALGGAAAAGVGPGGAPGGAGAMGAPSGMAGKPMRAKPAAKPQPLHYCEVCKISCAGPQTYREHLEGQKHKKKEAALKGGSSSVARGGNALRCELCDVTCTGSDAYAAHIRGAKHQKVVKLHTKLGKPIPSTDPVVVAGSTKTTTTTSSTSKSPVVPAASAKSITPVKKPAMAPKINFVAGSQDKVEVKEEPKSDSEMPKIEEKEIQPVGQDYIEEIKNDDGKVISFNCKLCECRFNDPNAKEMHMKGRRHRLQYKKKVNPDLIVDVKPSLRQRKIQEDKLRRQQFREELWRRREEERIMEEEERMYWEERRRYEEEMEYFEWYRRYGRDPRGLPPPMPRPFCPGVPPMMFFPQPLRRPDSSDDRHVIARHAEIYPKEEELQSIQRIVSHTEKALKFVSDRLADLDSGSVGVDIKKEGGEGVKKEEESRKEDGRDGNLFSFHREKDDSQHPRVLKGVMRVGVLAKGLLLHGDLAVRLVVLCSEKPTKSLLERVAEHLPQQLQAVAPDEKYEVKQNVEEASVIVSGTKEPRITVTITLTSPVMREQLLHEGSGGDSQNQAQLKDPPDVLDKQKCLDALAALRHAKWFQARATGLQSCVMVIRILRDLCQRVPTWAPLHSWAMELLVEKVMSSAGQPLSPGDALRRVLEAVASGLLLSSGPGLMDPCEKEHVDAAVILTPQQREDITASAQHALRLLAFRQIHKVLGMDPLPPPKFVRGRFNRKRRRDNSSGEGNESEGGDGKKDKKEDGEAEKMEMEKSDGSK